MVRLSARYCPAALISALLTGCVATSPTPMQTAAATPGAAILLRVAAAEDADPYRAGQLAAADLARQLHGVQPHAVIVSECFEDAAMKKRVLKGIASVFPRRLIYGGATYGSFDAGGCHDRDAVSLLAIAGPGIGVAAALEEDLGAAHVSFAEQPDLVRERLQAAGARLVSRVPRRSDDRLLVVIADAHSPKNGCLVEGLQQVLGGDFPITGGSVNKNAGQSFVYYQGRMYSDAAVALMLSGDLQLAMAGRKAQDNARIIATAESGAKESLGKLGRRPEMLLAFNCAGRKGKLERLEDELAAMRRATGPGVRLFGCYCAGEIGPADNADARPDVLSSGVGWHVMFTAIAQ